MVSLNSRDARILALFRSGAPFKHKGCPDPAAYDLVNPEVAASVFAAKNAVREKWITEHMTEMGCPRYISAMKFDMQHAPFTTNARQLTEIGITIPTAEQAVDFDSNQIKGTLWTILYGLARLGIYLSPLPATMGDRVILHKLLSKLLLEEVRDIPPSPDLSEFIDLFPDLPDGKIANVGKVKMRYFPTPDRSWNDIEEDSILA